MNKPMISVGVIGTGGMGGRHARNLALRTAGARVTAVMDADLERAQAVASECGDAQALNDGFALIAHDDVDAVVIASPDWTHAELALACMQAQKPVLCEKPLASNPALAEAILQAETELGRRLLQVGFMREFDPIHLDAKAVLDRGDIGRPVMFRAIHINPANRGVRTIEDVIINSAIHDIHSTRWIMEREVESVFVQYTLAKPEQPESCRMVSVQMKLQDNALAVLEVNADSGYGYEVDIEITGFPGPHRRLRAFGISIEGLDHVDLA
jgi:myo-inositol 2-dehydrogenase/D-chiro-inositol 1-dehydrogenase